MLVKYRRTSDAIGTALVQMTATLEARQPELAQEICHTFSAQMERQMGHKIAIQTAAPLSVVEDLLAILS
jgi:hypothetical protein